MQLLLNYVITYILLLLRETGSPVSDLEVLRLVGERRRLSGQGRQVR